MRDTPNTTGVATVYTPPPFRGRGYASIAVATLSQRLLDAGRRSCFLYSDLANLYSDLANADFYGALPPDRLRVDDVVDIAIV